MKTMQEKVRQMSKQVNELRRSGHEPQKAHCFSLLHDVVLFTDYRLDKMDKKSLAGYLEIAASVIHLAPRHNDIRIECRNIRLALVDLGFNTVPPDLLN